MTGLSSSEAATQACRDLGLDPDEAYRVEAMLEYGPEDFEPCCMSSCRPCILDLQHAVRRARRLLGRE